jgi:hypothetical protein
MYPSRRDLLKALAGAPLLFVPQHPAGVTNVSAGRRGPGWKHDRPARESRVAKPANGDAPLCGTDRGGDRRPLHSLSPSTGAVQSAVARQAPSPGVAPPARRTSRRGQLPIVSFDDWRPGGYRGQVRHSDAPRTLLRPGPSLPSEDVAPTAGQAAHLKLLENYTAANVQDLVAYPGATLVAMSRGWTARATQVVG